MMATYQEQIAKQQESKAAKVMLAMAELAHIQAALAILEREGILKPGEQRFFLIAYVHRHPEIQEHIDAAKKTISESSAAGERK